MSQKTITIMLWLWVGLSIACILWSILHPGYFHPEQEFWY
jgi:hypothetical protein